MYFLSSGVKGLRCMYYRPFSIADYEDVAIFSKPLYVFRSWLSVVIGRGGGGGGHPIQTCGLDSWSMPCEFTVPKAVNPCTISSTRTSPRQVKVYKALYCLWGVQSLAWAGNQLISLYCGHGFAYHYFKFQCNPLSVRALWLIPSNSQEWSISYFPCSLTRNITSHSMENFALHRNTQMKDDYTTNSHYLT